MTDSIALYYYIRIEKGQRPDPYQPCAPPRRVGQISYTQGLQARANPEISPPDLLKTLKALFR